MMGTLGVIALAFGIGVAGAFVLDRHSHTCDKCGNRWSHLGAFNGGDLAAHTCSSCGAVQQWKDGVSQEVKDAHAARIAKYQPGYTWTTGPTPAGGWPYESRGDS